MGKYLNIFATEAAYEYFKNNTVEGSMRPLVSVIGKKTSDDPDSWDGSYYVDDVKYDPADKSSEDGEY